MLDLTDKLRAYIDKVEKETGRSVLIQTTQDFGVSGMMARFLEHPTHILVEVAPNIPHDQFAQSIAHEVTHGLLAYARRYRRLGNPKRPPTPLEANTVSLLATMVEDIVVNKIIHENGFQPFAPNYLSVVREETKAARKGRDYYRQFQDPLFKDRFMVFRYIMAWGFLQFYDLDKYARKTLSRFESEFKSVYPNQYKLAGQVKDIITKNNIFTPEGYCSAIKIGLALWGLNDLVELQSYTGSAVQTT
jgi:hypothetical protein